MSTRQDSKEDFYKMLEEFNTGYSKDNIEDFEEFFKKLLDSAEFKKSAGGVINVKSDLYFKDKSSIHGVGMFAKKNIKQHDNIGIVLVNSNNDRQRTYLGRFTNHSHRNNIFFKETDGGDVVGIATRDIEKGDELLVDYRDHFLKW